jgi:hypothetical protein
MFIFNWQTILIIRCPNVESSKNSVTLSQEVRATEHKASGVFRHSVNKLKVLDPQLQQ